MKLKFLIIAILFFSTTVKSQNDTLNAFNAKGKKHGCWIQYINIVWNETTKENAVAYFYNQFDNGQPLLDLKNQKWKKKYKLVCEGNTPTQGNPVVLDGQYKWYNTKGQLMNEEHYKNGNPVFMKSYNYSNNNFATQTYNEVLKFDKKYKHQKSSFYYEELTYGVLRKAYYFRNGERGWKAYNIEPEEDAYIINDNRYFYGETPLYLINSKDSARVKKINTDVVFTLYLNPEWDKTITVDKIILKGRLLSVNDTSIKFIVTEENSTKEYRNGHKTKNNTIYSYATEEVREINFDQIKIMDVSFPDVNHRSKKMKANKYHWARGSSFKGSVKGILRYALPKSERVYFINIDDIPEEEKWLLKSKLE